MSTHRRVRVWPAVLTVLGIEAAGLAAVALISYLTEDTSGALRWVLPAVVAFGFAMIKVSVDLGKAEPTPRRPTDHRPQVRPDRSIGVVMIILVLLAGSGILVGLGARAGFEWLTGRQGGGVQRLAEPAERSRSGLGLEVSEVVVSRDFTRVTVAVINNTENTVVLPLFQNCLLTATDTTLEASVLPSRSRWSETVPVGSRTNGVIIFDGALPAAAETAKLSFGTVYRHGFDGPDTISITLPLRE